MNSQPNPLSEQEVQDAQAIGGRLLQELNQIILGQETLVRQVITAALAGGHVLLEGLPGLGKTELIKGLAHLLDLDFRRVQFTPDLLPGDITGGPILEEKNGERNFVFRPGPIFCNILLADEINRASPKTQSALLEAMAEARVTVMGETRSLPNPFFVLATQNPIELEGTYPLPEAQLDRFLFKVTVHPVSAEVLKNILQTRRHGKPPRPQMVAQAKDFIQFQKIAGRVHFPDAVMGWIARICEASQPGSTQAPAMIQQYVRYGASPRAAISIAEAARIDALLDGKNTVGFDNVRRVAEPALSHRLVLNHQARLDQVSPQTITKDLLNTVSEMHKPLPKEVVDTKA